VKRRALLAALATTTIGGCMEFGDDQSTTRQRFESGGQTTALANTSASTGTLTEEPTEFTEEPTTPTEQPTTANRTTTDRERWRVRTDPVASTEVAFDADLAYPDLVENWDISVLNDSNDARTFRTRVDADGERVLDETTTVPTDRWFQVLLPQKAAYDVAIQAEDGLSWRRHVAREDYMCGGFLTTIEFHPDFVEKVVDEQNAVGCPSPLDGIEWIQTDGECSSDSEHEASVTFADGDIRIDGRFPTGTPCFNVVSWSAPYYFRTDTLFVRLLADETDADGCEPCGAIQPYEYSIPVDAAYPDTVVVEHYEEDGEEHVVARAHPSE